MGIPWLSNYLCSANSSAPVVSWHALKSYSVVTFGTASSNRSNRLQRAALTKEIRHQQRQAARYLSSALSPYPFTVEQSLEGAQVLKIFRGQLRSSTLKFNSDSRKSTSRITCSESKLRGSSTSVTGGNGCLCSLTKSRSLSGMAISQPCKRVIQ